MEFLGHGLNLPGKGIPVDTGSSTNTDLISYSESFTLTKQIPIIRVASDLKNLSVTDDPETVIEIGELMILQLDGVTSNETLYQVREIEKVTEQLTLKLDRKLDARVISAIEKPILIKKSKVINHQLSSESIVFSIIHESGMIANHMSSATIENNNQIKLSPDLPVAGTFTITVIAKKQ